LFTASEIFSWYFSSYLDHITKVYFQTNWKKLISHQTFWWYTVRATDSVTQQARAPADVHSITATWKTTDIDHFIWCLEI